MRFYLPLLIQIYLASRVNFFYVLGLYTSKRVDSGAAFLEPFGLQPSRAC